MHFTKPNLSRRQQVDRVVFRVMNGIAHGICSLKRDFVRGGNIFSGRSLFRRSGFH